MTRVGRETTSKRNKYGQIAPTRTNPDIPDPKYRDTLKIEFSLRRLEIDNSSRRNFFKLEGRCLDGRGILKLRNFLENEEIFSNVEYRVSPVVGSSKERHGKIIDTRSTFSIRGEIQHLMGKRKIKK